MTFTGFDHVGLTVSDLDRSLEWYTRFLGYGPRSVLEYSRDYLDEIVGYAGCRFKVALFDLPSGLLELIEYLTPAPGSIDMETSNVGNAHLCLQTDDLRADYERLRGFAEFRSAEPVTIDFGTYRGSLCCYLRDPDDFTLELVELPRPGPEQPAGETQVSHSDIRP